jgi:hypothetical protein
VGGDVPRDMMDFVGQCLYVVEMVWMCALAMCPLYTSVFIVLCG